MNNKKEREGEKRERREIRERMVGENEIKGKGGEDERKGRGGENERKRRGRMRERGCKG